MAWQVVAALGAAAAAAFAVIGIIVTGVQNRNALATARDQLTQSRTQEQEQRNAAERQLRAEIDGQQGQIALQRASTVRTRLLAEVAGMYNLADRYVIDQVFSSFAAEVGRYLRTLATSDNRTLDSLIEDDGLSFIVAVAWARDQVARSYFSEVRHTVTTCEGFGGELHFAASIASLLSNIVNDFQQQLLQILNDDTRGPVLRHILKGDPPEGSELTAVTGVATLVTGQLSIRLPVLSRLQDVLKFAQSLLSTEDDKSILAAAQATIAFKTEETLTDALSSTLVPLAKRLGGDAAATRAEESIDALKTAIDT
jgi:multidrug efflux pump subunit AcrA (membrane-fusion protein)